MSIGVPVSVEELASVGIMQFGRPNTEKMRLYSTITLITWTKPNFLELQLIAFNALNFLQVMQVEGLYWAVIEYSAYGQISKQIISFRRMIGKEFHLRSPVLWSLKCLNHLQIEHRKYGLLKLTLAKLVIGWGSSFMVSGHLPQLELPGHLQCSIIKIGWYQIPSIVPFLSSFWNYLFLVGAMDFCGATLLSSIFLNINRILFKSFATGRHYSEINQSANWCTLKRLFEAR